MWNGQGYRQQVLLPLLGGQYELQSYFFLTIYWQCVACVICRPDQLSSVSSVCIGSLMCIHMMLSYLWAVGHPSLTRGNATGYFADQIQILYKLACVVLVVPSSFLSLFGTGALSVEFSQGIFQVVLILYCKWFILLCHWVCWIFSTMGYMVCFICYWTYDYMSARET